MGFSQPLVPGRVHIQAMGLSAVGTFVLTFLTCVTHSCAGKGNQPQQLNALGGWFSWFSWLRGWDVTHISWIRFLSRAVNLNLSTVTNKSGINLRRRLRKCPLVPAIQITRPDRFWVSFGSVSNWLHLPFNGYIHPEGVIPNPKAIPQKITWEKEKLIKKKTYRKQNKCVSKRWFLRKYEGYDWSINTWPVPDWFIWLISSIQKIRIWH